MNEQNIFSEVTLLITVYNRSRSLERLLAAFENLNVRFGEIIVSDDCSRPEHIKAIRDLQAKYAFNLITTPVNRGLGHNINKGQDAVETPFTLYVQEDFVPRNIFPACLHEAVRHMHGNGELDMVRFYSYFKFPYLKPVNGELSEMLFDTTFAGYKKFYMYSDHPHLRRSNFLSKFGRYKEGANIDVTEYRMMISFLQKKGKAFYYENHKDIFDQLNSPDEPSSFKRDFWRESNNVIVSSVRHIYRYVKFRLDYSFRKN